MEEEYEYYEELETDEDITFGDIAFIGGLAIGGCLIVAFICFIIRKTFKNVHLKIGNKIEVGMETKED